MVKTQGDKMIESHAHQQRFHYQVLKNPSYQWEGLQSVLYEEMMMNMPTRQPIIQQKVVTTNISLEKYNNLLRTINGLQERIDQLTLKRKKKSKYD